MKYVLPLLVLALAVCSPTDPPPTSPPPAADRSIAPDTAGADTVDVRAALDPFTGTWRGTFVVYTYDGEPITRLEAEHRYHWEGDVQVGTFIDRYPDGRVVRAEARNYLEGGVLWCEVMKDNGERTVHQGRYEDGAVFWHRQLESGLTETFRERVVEAPSGQEYQIDGFGAYPNDGGGRSYVVYKGRYQAVAASD
jgi:hypothetical protein